MPERTLKYTVDVEGLDKIPRTTQSPWRSTRFWVVVVGVIVTLTAEVMFQVGREVRPETLQAIQAGLAALLGLDTIRPLGQRTVFPPTTP